MDYFTKQMMWGDISSVNKFVLVDYMEMLHGTREFSRGNVKARMGDFSRWKLVDEFPLEWLDTEEYDLDTGLVDEYVTKYEETGYFPPIVCRFLIFNSDNYENRWTILDGLHRTASAVELDLDYIPAYIPREQKKEFRHELR